MEERILKAAMKVFAREGYKGATTRKIAQEAGVNEVTLFRKFKTKENILRMVITRNRDEALERLDSILIMEKNKDIPTCLGILGQNFMGFMEERMELMIMMMIEGQKNPKIAKILASFPKKMAEHLSNYIEEQMARGNLRQINSKVAAFSYISYIFYNTLFSRIFHENIFENRKKALDEFINIYTKGILRYDRKELKTDKLKKDFIKKARVEVRYEDQTS